jgi:hypothetical protein
VPTTSKQTPLVDGRLGMVGYTALSLFANAASVYFGN